jgi:ABC-type dipeptide/oligopeptide/nickel transport system permease subunit
LQVRFYIVRENQVMSLHMMSRCKHHILTSSTLSFWGAYLDPNQPNGGRTVYHPSFEVDHGIHMVPYTFWERIT